MLVQPLNKAYIRSRSARGSQMFLRILQPDALRSLIGESMAKSLAMIGVLTKLSNSPIILKAALEKKGKLANDDSDSEGTGASVEDAMRLLP